MSKERLSRLQKWILQEASKAKYIDTDMIYRGYYGLDGGKGYPYVNDADRRRARSAWVSVCGSLRRLVEKGLLEGDWHYAHRIFRTKKINFGN
jgi:hypothetical protein